MESNNRTLEKNDIFSRKCVIQLKNTSVNITLLLSLGCSSIFLVYSIDTNFKKSKYHLESGIGCFGTSKCSNDQEYVSLLALY